MCIRDRLNVYIPVLATTVKQLSTVKEFSNFIHVEYLQYYNNLKNCTGTNRQKSFIVCVCVFFTLLTPKSSKFISCIKSFGIYNT